MLPTSSLTPSSPGGAPAGRPTSPRAPPLRGLRRRGPGAGGGARALQPIDPEAPRLDLRHDGHARSRDPPENPPPALLGEHGPDDDPAPGELDRGEADEGTILPPAQVPFPVREDVELGSHGGQRVRLAAPDAVAQAHAADCGLRLAGATRSCGDRAAAMTRARVMRFRAVCHAAPTAAAPRARGAPGHPVRAG